MKYILIFSIVAAMLGGCAIVPAGYGDQRTATTKSAITSAAAATTGTATTTKTTGITVTTAIAEGRAIKRIRSESTAVNEMPQRRAATTKRRIPAQCASFRA